MRKGIHIIGSEGIIERERPRILFEVSFAIAHAQGKSYYWFRRHNRERKRERPRILLEVLRMRKGYHLIGAHAKGLYLIGAHALKVFISLVGWLAGEMPLEMWQVYCTVYQAGLLCWMKTYTLKQLQKIPLFEKVEKLALNIYFCTYIFAFENHQNTFNNINHCPLYPIFLYILL